MPPPLQTFLATSTVPLRYPFLQFRFTAVPRICLRALPPRCRALPRILPAFLPTPPVVPSWSATLYLGCYRYTAFTTTPHTLVLVLAAHLFFVPGSAVCHCLVLHYTIFTHCVHCTCSLLYIVTLTSVPAIHTAHASLPTGSAVVYCYLRCLRFVLALRCMPPLCPAVRLPRRLPLHTDSFPFCGFAFCYTISLGSACLFLPCLVHYMLPAFFSA